jgi:hypothetical protein
VSILILLCQGFIYEDMSTVESWVSVLIQTLVVSMVIGCFAIGFWGLYSVVRSGRRNSIFIDFSTFRYLDESLRLELLLIYALQQANEAKDEFEIKVNHWNDMFKTSFAATRDTEIVTSTQVDDVFRSSIATETLEVTDETRQFSQLVQQALQAKALPQDSWSALVSEFQQFIRENRRVQRINSISSF